MEFIKVGGTHFNTAWIKTIKCDDKKCVMVVANGYTRDWPDVDGINQVKHYGTVHNYDSSLTFSKDMEPEPYQALCKYITRDRYRGGWSVDERI